MLQSRVASRAAHVAELQAALADGAAHFYLDTSFLIGLGALHEAARAELMVWLEALGPRVHVPAWAAHELSTKIVTDTRALTPMANEAAGVLSALGALQAEARRFVDDPGVAGYRARPGAPAPDRVGFLAELDSEVRALTRRLQFLKSQSAKAVDGAVAGLTDFVNTRVLDSDIYGDMATLEARHAARVMGRHPPGTSDRAKDENRYGDLIIWSEVVAHAANARVDSVVLLTNDNKPDWVFAPSAVLEEDGRQSTNSSDRGHRVVKPLPLLVHELRRENASVALHIVNIAYLAQTLHAARGPDFKTLVEAYQASTTRAPLSEPAEAEPQVATAAPPEPAAAETPSSATLIRDLGATEPDALQAAVQLAREHLPNFTAADAADLARAVAEAAGDSETAAVLVRDLVEGRAGGNHRQEVLAAVAAAAYFDASGAIRNRPSRSVTDALFAAETLPELRPILENVEERLGPNRRFLLLTPHPQGAPLDLQVQAIAGAGGARNLTGLFHGEQPLLQDAPRGSPRSLQVLMGSNEGRVADLARLVSDYFEIPLRKLRLGLPQSERITWDELRGFVDWGTHRRVPLR